MTEGPPSQKSAGAFRTIGEVAEELKLPQHVLRFWETRFPQVKPLKRAGGRRFYRPEDMALLAAIQFLLYTEGYTIKGVQRLLQEQGPSALATAARAGRVSPDIDHGEDAVVTRDDPKLPASRPPRSPARTGSEPTPSSRPMPDAAGRDIVARLQGVVHELAECGRILATLRS